MVHDLSRSTDVPTVAESDHFSNYSVLVDCTTVDSSIAAGDNCRIQAFIEGYNFQRIAQKVFTISFWHKHTKTGTYCVSFINSSADRSYVAEYTQSVADTWEKATITVVASPSAGTWDYTNGIGLKIVWSLAIGSTYHTTANAWQTGNYFATSNQVNACDSTSNNFRIAQIQIEPGATATEFESRTIQRELDFIYRYFWRLTESGGIDFQFCNGVFHTTTTGKCALIYPRELRAAPTISHSGASDFTVQAGLSRTLSSLSVDNITKHSCRLDMSVSAAVGDGDGANLAIAASTGGYIEIDARL
jgi:hypothetical protein